MQLTIREMTSEDWPAVARIYQEGMDTNLATFKPNVRVGKSGTRCICQDAGWLPSWMARSQVGLR